MKFAGLALAFAWAVYAETPITAKLCDMVEHADQFNSKLVSVRAEVVVGFEMQALIDGSRPNERIWFELEQPKRNHEYKTLNRAWKNNDFDIRKEVAATLLGTYETGECFGHQCFSKTQLRVRQVMNVTAIERRLAPDFSAYDCSLLTRDVKVHFQKGHIDNVPEDRLFMASLRVVLTGPNDESIVAEAHPIFQIALAPNRLNVLEPRDGVFRLPSLAPALMYSRPLQMGSNR